MVKYESLSLIHNLLSLGHIKYIFTHAGTNAEPAHTAVNRKVLTQAEPEPAL